MRKILVAGCLLFASFPVAAAEAMHVEASLIASGASPARDAPLWVGLKMRHQAGWHTYWKNPGDAGMPTRIDWTLPAGWSASGIEWPAPARIQLGPLASYGYEGDLVLPVKLIPPSGWDAKSPVRISAKANWLVCKEICIPEGGNFTLSLPARVSEPDRKLFDAWRERVPVSFRFTKATAERNAGRLVVTLEPAGSGQFFPEREELVEPGDPPQVTITGKRATWSAKLGVQGKTLAATAMISGVWVPESGKPLFVQAKLR
jgi:DsbC/DsbD-like thiol-disulfide interchange protein